MEDEIITTVTKNDTLTFFGDAYGFSLTENVLYFPRNKVVCDFTECGMYIANKHAKHEKPQEINIMQLLYRLPWDTKVKAHNNGIARFFEDHDIKTVRDLIRAILLDHLKHL